MDAKEMAARLDGHEYRQEVGVGDKILAIQHGLVIVYGASDDLIEFDGAINDEGDVFDGGTVYLDGDGLFKTGNCSGDVDRCPYLIDAWNRCSSITAVWNGKGGEWAWTYETDIPHEEFRIYEDGEAYCKGIVFRISDISKGVDAIPVGWLIRAMKEADDNGDMDMRDAINCLLAAWRGTKSRRVE